MRVGVVLEDAKGVEGFVSSHFGQCAYFLLADIDDKTKKVLSTEVVPNTVSHGGGGCVAVDELLKHKISYVIAGGMGMGAQSKFTNAGVRVFGYTGKVKDALDAFLKDNLGGLGACREHGGGDCH